MEKAFQESQWKLGQGALAAPGHFVGSPETRTWLSALL